MKEEFITKLNNREYISKSLYHWVLTNAKSVIPDVFDIDKYNETILDREYVKYKNYFENMYKGIDDNIKLDEEQIKAILADEEYALIIAGAGTGKTTTMTAKVKYLVDIKKVDPHKILVMSYTKKAVNELAERIVDNFNIPAKVVTFHSLGFEYIRQIFSNRRCTIVGYNDKQNIFLEYFKTKYKNKEEIREIIESFKYLKNKNWLVSDYFKENYEKYDSYEEFFNAYKKHKIEEAKNRGIVLVVQDYVDKNTVSESIKTIKGEEVKSVPEMIIANFLFRKSINYKYEEIYSEIIEDNRSYRPDFTLDLAGQKVYLEYYGMDSPSYNRIKTLKREHHKNNRNLYIELDQVALESIEKELDKELKKMGFVYREKTNEEIYERILDNNPFSQIYPFKDFIYDCIDIIKSSLKRSDYKKIIQDHINTMTAEEQVKAKIQFKYIDEFYLFYNEKLYGDPNLYFFDYPDLLYYANLYINKISKNKIDFDYIIIDEYQDISRNRYELVKRTATKNNAKVFAVGDDWQSIYAFSGARIEYLYNFENYFKGSKLFKISKTYRNSQELIDYSGDFIMKNESQIKKDLISDKHSNNPIIFVRYETDREFDVELKKEEERQVLKRLILKIYEKKPKHKILILGRTNAIVDSLFDDKELKDDIDTKITYKGYEDIEIEAMTMHKSKGLTFDEVIVIGLNKYFPIDRYGMYWLEELFDNALYDEEYSFAEERRLFYVALTRTKNRVFLLTNSDQKDRSPFLDELYYIINKH